GALNVLQAARECGVDRVVHTSTSEVYGSARTIPIAETHPLRGQSPYAATKIGADKLAEAFHLSYGVPVVTVRPFNTFGPRQSGRAIIPTIISQCLTDTVVRLGNTSPTRDMNYVSDIIEGFLRAAIVDAAVGRTINLGSGCETSVHTLVELIVERTGTAVSVEREATRVRPEESEVERLVADATLARELLDWQPSVSLEAGLDLTVAWIREHLDEYRADAYAI
ncbi:MAG: GDP-mannose 4,6-dehydratase, partial [Candidatus Omnitrophota bacterium]|nr:GDP-mannose 4,6-dehydratase [Candidatus Omnitrophota bacterium]